MQASSSTARAGLTTPAPTRTAVAAAAAAIALPRSSHRRASLVATRAAAASSSEAPPPVTKPTLYDAPVSNNGARVRYVIYSQNLDVDIQPPTALGGLRSPAYLALNPQGKMPLLQLPTTDDNSKTLPASAVYESEVISQFLLDAYCAPGTLTGADAASRARAAMATRVHDLYITTAQGAMYKGGMSPEQRSAGLKQLSDQLDALERIVAAGGGPFIAGAQVTTADAALAPTFEFLTFILPRHFGWKDVLAGRPALRAWWEGLRGRDPVMARVLDEVRGGLEGWQAKDRWGELGIRQQVEKAGARYAF
jgi:glutathione S-transferase